jgi:hypothetical protein
MSSCANPCNQSGNHFNIIGSLHVLVLNFLLSFVFIPFFCACSLSISSPPPYLRVLVQPPAWKMVRVHMFLDDSTLKLILPGEIYVEMWSERFVGEINLGRRRLGPMCSIT